MADEPEDELGEIEVEADSLELWLDSGGYCDRVDLLREMVGLPDNVPLVVQGFEGAHTVAIPGRGCVTIHEIFKEMKTAKPAKLASIKGGKQS